MFVLLVGVILEGLEADSDGDLIAGIHNPGVRLDTVPGKGKRLLGNILPKSYFEF